MDFTIVKDFLEPRIGKVLVLRMSSMNPFPQPGKETFIVQTGIIDSVIFQEETDTQRAGFYIQLKYRDGKLYPDPEKFFGTFELFTVEEGRLSDTLKVLYKDGSYFLLEVRI